MSIFFVNIFLFTLNNKSFIPQAIFFIFNKLFVMKNLFFIIFVCISTVSATSCHDDMQVEKFLDQYSDTAITGAQDYMKFAHKYRLFSANKNTTDIDIHVLKNESRWISIYSMRTNCDYISLAFYPREAVISKGKIRKDWNGSPRFYYIFLPKWEKLEACDERGITLSRRNGEKHEIKFNIIND